MCVRVCAGVYGASVCKHVYGPCVRVCVCVCTGRVCPPAMDMDVPLAVSMSLCVNTGPGGQTGDPADQQQRCLSHPLRSPWRAVECGLSSPARPPSRDPGRRALYGALWCARDSVSLGPGGPRPGWLLLSLPRPSSHPQLILLSGARSLGTDHLRVLGTKLPDFEKCHIT